jgi:ferritin-like metal-binding protein YciE
MSITSKRELFDRELRKLYHAEIEILDLHSDLAAAAASDKVTAIFGGHEGDTVDQIDRIEEIFATLDMETREQGSPIMEGLIAEKDQFVLEIEDDELRDLDVINIGMINERLEITLLDRLILLADELGLPEPTVENLEANREEAQTALGRMQQYLEDRRVT